MSEPKFRFIALSDVHILPFPHWSLRVFDHTMEAVATKLPKSDLVLFNGDIVYQLDSWQDGVCREIHSECYDHALSVIERHLPPEQPRMFVLGNHEFPQNNMDPALNRQALEVWKQRIGEPMCEHRVVSGYHFIKYPVLDWDMAPTPEYEAWAKQELLDAIADDPSKPVFFVSHGTVPDTAGSDKSAPSFTNDFRAFLSEHYQIIHVSGHHHIHLLDDRLVWQGGFTAVTLPYVAVGYFDADVTKFPERRPRCSQTMVFEVYDRRVEVYGMDHATDTIVGDRWIIDLDELEQGIARYDDAARKHAPLPQFAADAAVTATGDAAGTSVTVQQSFAPESPFPLYYRFTVANHAGEEMFCHQMLSDYYNKAQNVPYADALTYTLPPLPAGEYTVTVHPVNAFSVCGEPVTAALTVTSAS